MRHFNRKIQEPAGYISLSDLSAFLTQGRNPAPMPPPHRMRPDIASALRDAGTDPRLPEPENQHDLPGPVTGAALYCAAFVSASPGAGAARPGSPRTHATAVPGPPAQPVGNHGLKYAPSRESDRESERRRCGLTPEHVLATRRFRVGSGHQAYVLADKPDSMQKNHNS